ncbi:MAG: glycosyltransferase family 2 protein [Lachnospiraceae bacterium]|nr:glycosyltransferase family 2 protein [Lachnospiraceae bacterium]
MKDLISIIVPVYRVEQYLEQCIQSIRNQTYRKLEIILVDDGSDDQCPLICDQHAFDDKRIKVIHKKNGGLDSARKAGILAANGKYIGYVDGDDWIEPEMYEKLYGYAQQYDVDVVESGAIDLYINEEKKRVPYIKEGCYKDMDFVQKIEPNLLYSGNFFEYGISAYLWSKLFVKERIWKYQMMEDLTNEIHNDSMVALPCIAETKSLYVSHDCYYHYRVRGNTLKRRKACTEVSDLFICYPEFYNRFKNTKLNMESGRQIKYYVMYWLLCRAPYVFDDLSAGKILMPFGGVKVNDKIILYGAGAAGIHLEHYIHGLEGNNLVCWVDRNYETLQDTLNVKKPSEIMNYEFDYIIISILRERTVMSAKKDLENLGVQKEKILWIDQKYIDNPELLLNRVIYQGKLLI